MCSYRLKWYGMACAIARPECAKMKIDCSDFFSVHSLCAPSLLLFEFFFAFARRQEREWERENMCETIKTNLPYARLHAPWSNWWKSKNELVQNADVVCDDDDDDDGHGRWSFCIWVAHTHTHTHRRGIVFLLSTPHTVCVAFCLYCVHSD